MTFIFASGMYVFEIFDLLDWKNYPVKIYLRIFLLHTYSLGFPVTRTYLRDKFDFQCICDIAIFKPR